MPEAVIVDAIRTPIGRALKGSLKTVRADELAAIPIRALMQRNRQADFLQAHTRPASTKPTQSDSDDRSKS